MRAVLCMLLLLGFTGCASTSNLQVVSGFKAERYLGTWYELARYPHGFEEGLTDVSAVYTQNPDGSIKVVNKGYNPKTASWETALGEAKFKGHKDMGWLKVSFFKPFYASYKILYLNKDYTQAIVTGPTYGYLWILARDPVLPGKELKSLIRKATVLGFDADQMIIVEQTGKQKS